MLNDEVDPGTDEEYNAEVALIEYLADSLILASEKVMPDMPQECGAYLTNLLAKVVRGYPEANMDRVVCFWQYSISELDSQYEQALQYQILADAMMLKTGLFRTAMANSVLPVKYYLSAAKYAYSAASRLQKRFSMDHALADELHCMSLVAAEASDVLACAAKKLFPNYVSGFSDDLLLHYECVIDNNSQHSKNILLQHGITPILIIPNTNLC